MFVLKDREEIEWTNCWWSDANQETERILLIGDSVTRAIRSSLEYYMFDRYAIDLFAASFSLNDPLFWKHLSCFMESSDYTYKCIIVQYGVQHDRFRKCSVSAEERQCFKTQYIRLLKLLIQMCPTVFLMTGNSNADKNQPDKIDEEFEPEIVCRNSIIKEVGGLLQCDLFDFYLLVHNSGCKFVDNIHLDKNSYMITANYLAKFLMRRKVIELKYDDIRRQVIGLFGKSKQVIIYGAGKNAEDLYWMILFVCGEEYTIDFVQTIVEEEISCCGSRVLCIDDVPVKNREEVVLIISSPVHFCVMKSKAVALGFKNIRRYEEFIKVTEVPDKERRFV